jgi:predicted nucleotidyltransferase
MKFYGVENVYSESGIDLSLLKSSLNLSLADRLRQTRNAALLGVALQQSNPRLRKMYEGVAVTVADFQSIIKVLVEDKVDFVVIGGLAMVYHGSAQSTRDVDVCYGRTPENIERLAQALASLRPYMRGAPRGLPFRFDAPTIQAGLNFTLDTDLGPVDLLGEVRGIGFFEQVLAHSQPGDLLGFPVQVLSIDGLIMSKKAAGRHKDQGHILELEELKKLKKTEGT